MELKNLQKLPESIRAHMQAYLEGFIPLHGENILSVFVYSSIVPQEYSLKDFHISLGVVFKELKFKQLKTSLRQVKSGMKKNISAPLFLTLEHINSSLDVFPLEFFQMKDTCILLYGEDVLGGIKIDKEHLRLEVEEQIKGKLIHIRQSYLEMGLEKKGIDVLLKVSLNSLIPVFRGLLKLAQFDQTPPEDKFEIIEQLHEKFKADKEVFVSILKDEKDDHTIMGKDAEEYLARYIEEIQKLAKMMDTIQ